MAWKIEADSNIDGKSNFVARVKQYTQCELGNHQTSEIKMVEEWHLKEDANRELARIVADALMLTNTKVLEAHKGYAKIHYTYTNKIETVTWKVKELATV